MNNDIKILIMDVDGTLTDGKIYMGKKGEILKAFNIKDGYGIKNKLINNKIIPVIITGRKSKVLKNRCKELEITHVYQNVLNKVKCLEYVLKEMKMDYNNVAYIGDDLNDYDVMIKIKKLGGIIGAPQNATKEIIEICDFISNYNGGEGAVRDFIDWILNSKD